MAGREQRNSREPKRVGVWAKKLACLLLSTAISFLVGELIIRTFVTVREVGPSFTAYDPVYGKRPRRNLTCRRATPELSMWLKTDSRGFRGPELPPVCRDAVVFLGDSFTMGYGVNDGEEFPSLVRRALTERYGPDAPPVINAGMAGNGNGRWVKFLREDAGQYDPQLVVLQVCSNDRIDNVAEGLFRLSSSGELIELPVPPPGMLFRLQRIIEALPGLSDTHTIGLLRQAVENTLGGVDPRSSSGRSGTGYPLAAAVSARTAGSPEEDALTDALIERSWNTCQRRNWHVVVIEQGLKGERLAALKRRCHKFGVTLITTPVKQERPDLYFKVDGHWNASGHRYVANLILEQLQSDRRMPRPARKG